MTKEEFWKKFKDGALYIHTPTEEQCMTFVQMSKESGIYLDLNMQEYYRYSENTCLGVVKKDDLDIVSRVIVETRMGKDIDSWLAYGETEDISDYQTVEFSEVFDEEVKQEESEPNIKAMLSCKINENDTVCTEAHGEGENILIGLSSIIAALAEEGIPEPLINMAVKDGIKHAKK